MDVLRGIEISLLILICGINVSFLVYTFEPILTGKMISLDDSESNFDFISEDKIQADSEKVVFYVENSTLSRFESSNSMAPFLTVDSTGVGIKPSSEKEIQVGSVISFWKNGELIVHRIVEKGLDKEGVYFITKGDNNFKDDGKIRFEDIDTVLIAVIY